MRIRKRLELAAPQKAQHVTVCAGDCHRSTLEAIEGTRRDPASHLQAHLATRLEAKDAGGTCLSKLRGLMPVPVLQSE